MTPAAINLADSSLFGASNFGVMDVVADPVRKSDLYAFTCYWGVWRSTDYGKTWAKVSAPDSVLDSGRQWAAAIDPTVTRDAAASPTLYTTNGYGQPDGLFVSKDWGVTWTQKVIPPAGSFDSQSVYSISIDPYDGQHILVGFHETPGIAESTDGAKTWRRIATVGSGNSIYPFFVDTGNAATTRQTWLAIPQQSGPSYRTTNSGADWQEAGGFSHPHGSSQIFNAGRGEVIIGMIGGAYRSTDSATSWTPIYGSNFASVIGTSKNLYLGGAGINFNGTPPEYLVAPRTQPAVWKPMNVPASLVDGSKAMAVTFDGTHNVVVSGSWRSGIWRYVEP